MASLTVHAPDGKTLNVDVPQGTDPKQYDTLADDAIQHYTSADGPMKSLFMGIANQMPLGPQFSALMAKGPYSQNMAAINARVAQDKENHPVPYGAGAVGGTLALAAIPSVGELMAANPATTGALLGGTNAISNTDLTKDPGQAAKDAAMGTVTGALTGGILGKIMPAVGSKAEEMANNRANSSVNMPKNILVDMTPAERQAQGAALRAGGVVTSDKQEALDKASGLLKDYGQKIGTIAQKTEGQGLTVPPDQHYSAVTNLLNKAEEFSGSANKVSKAIGRDYKAGATDITNLPENPSWSDVQSLKEKYGSFAFKGNATQGAKDTYFALSNMLKGIADKAQADPSLGPQYKQALAGYSQMSPVVDGLKDAVDSDLRGQSGSSMALHPMRALASMPRPLRLALGTVATAAGHPLVGIGGGLLPEALNPAVQSNIMGGLAKASPDIQNGLVQLASKAATNPEAKAKMSDLINQLKQKFKDRSNF